MGKHLNFLMSKLLFSFMTHILSTPHINVFNVFLISSVHHILNVTREIDNFFPGMFNYLNVRVLDDEKTDLLKHWDNTFKYITRARYDIM